MSSIPTITEEDIRELVGPAGFQRGQTYYREDTIFNARRQDMTLKARCEGSRPEPYHVEATFNNTGVASTDCTCPIGSYCKHVAALLLTWVHRPEEFLEQPDVDTLLEQYSKAELIKLIKKMLTRNPDLEMLLATSGSKQASINLDSIRRQVASAFRKGGYDWGAEAEIADDLFTIKETADELIEQKDYTNAVAVYEILVTETLEQASEYQDENGDLHSVINESVVSLGECLDEVQDNKGLREQIMHILFRAYSYDIEMGGIGVAQDAPEILIGYATPEERQMLVGWVQDTLSKKEVAYDGSGWRHEQYGGFLLELQAGTLDDETFLRISRETGRTHDLINRLLQLGRLDEAIKEAQQVNSYQLTDIADLFVQHGQSTAAEEIVRERTKKPQEASMHETRLLEWLKQRYLARNDLEATLELALELFHKYPSLAGYQEIRTLATQLNRWETLRPQLLASLNQTQHTNLLIQIALDESDIDKALQLVQADQQQQPNYMGLGYSSPIALQVAQAAEETRPISAIHIYQRQAERLIAQRARASYQQACTYLAKVRNLYDKLGQHELWTSYITGLREQNRSLRALKEELAAAGL